MAALFGFGAFSSPVGQLVEQATDNAASAGNIALHLQICDAINSSDAGPKEAVAAFRKRLTGSAKNFHIINLTLTLIETTVKNCGTRLHVKVAQKDFLKDLMGVINPKVFNNPPTIVRERVLGLIQYWTDSFRGKPQLSAVVELYEQLRDEGTEFPPIDLDSLAPVETPIKSGGGSGQLQLVQREDVDSMSAPQNFRPSRRSIGPMKPEQVAKLLSELDVVRRNLDVMNELLVENEPGREVSDDLQLMTELHTTLRAMQERATALIGRVTDEIVLESLLQINDELNTCFTRYDRHVKNRQALKEGTQQKIPEPNLMATSDTNFPPDSSLPAISYPSMDDNPPAYDESGGGEAVGQLIDLGIELDSMPQPQVAQLPGEDIVDQLAGIGITGGSQQPVPMQPAPVLSSELVGSDNFDMFAQSRLAYSGGGSTYADNKQQQDVSLTSHVHRQPQPMAPPPQNATFVDLQQWVGSSDQPQQQQQPVTEDQASSAEFDQFLAQRAAKNRPRAKMQQQEDLNDELFQL